MNSRRAFLKAMGPAAAAIVVATSVKSAEEDEDLCLSLAQCLADEMQKRHGGRWHSEINHEIGAAYIFKS